jgi:hypothetical protein
LLQAFCLDFGKEEFQSLFFSPPLQMSSGDVNNVVLRLLVCHGTG